MTDITLEQRARDILQDEYQRTHAANPKCNLDEATWGLAHRAVTKALRLPAGADWQPIETAPKDGTKILIWRDGWDYAPVAWRDAIDCDEGSFGAWVFADHLCLGVGDGCLGWNEDIEDGHMPTHWMPLPAAPRHESGEG